MPDNIKYYNYETLYALLKLRYKSMRAGPSLGIRICCNRCPFCGVHFTHYDFHFNEYYNEVSAKTKCMECGNIPTPEIHQVYDKSYFDAMRNN